MPDTETLEFLDTESGPAPDNGELHDLEVDSKHDYVILAQALTSRRDELEKLAKKNREEGYLKEAKAVSADAERISEALLPQCLAQRELPLTSVAEIRAGIANRIRSVIRGRLIVNVDGGLSQEEEEIGVRDRESLLVEALAIHIEAFGEEVARRAHANGLAEREHGPQAVMAASMTYTLPDPK